MQLSTLPLQRKNFQFHSYLIWIILIGKEYDFFETHLFFDKLKVVKAINDKEDRSLKDFVKLFVSLEFSYILRNFNWESIGMLFFSLYNEKL